MKSQRHTPFISVYNFTVYSAQSTTSHVCLYIGILCVLVGFCHRAWAQSYTTIVVFGDSLSDVGNDATLSSMKYGVTAQVPGTATGYTNGRFTDGLDTIPPAHNYTGVWVEQLAAKLAAHPVVKSSLSGGADYAYGYATTNTGTSQLTYGPSNALAITVNNMGQQVADYFSTGPTINSSTLFVVWGGANDLLTATSSADVVNAATRETALVQQLISAGATDILIPNLPPLGLIPRLNQMPTQSTAATMEAQAFNQTLSAGLAQLPGANPGKTLHLFALDVYTLFNTIVGPPLGPGLSNVTSSSSVFYGLGNPTLNPDTYLFWDDLHPTTYGHSLIAAAALTLLGSPIQTTLNLSASTTNANLNSTVQFTASIAAASGIPTGTVTFLDGSTVLGTSLVSGSNSPGSATYSTSALAAGTHTIHATFTGVNGYVSSTSSNLTVTVTAPAYTASASATSLTLSRGGLGMSTITVSSVGGYSGSFIVACGSVPAKIGCSIGTGSLSITSGSTASSTVTINTSNVANNHVPVMFGVSGSGIVFAVLLMPATLYMPFGCKRRAMPNLIRAGFFVIALGGATVLNGCAGDPLAHDTPAGSYQIPVVVTPASGSATTITLSVTVQ